METQVVVREDQMLPYHVGQVMQKKRRFETAADAVSRMMLAGGVNKLMRGGRTVYDFRFFRQGGKHLVGWFEETGELVNFVKDAAAGGASGEMAFVLVGEPGNGKTFFVEYICTQYREFLRHPENRRYTVEFVNLHELGTYGKIHKVQSQTFEDPMVIATNLFEKREKCQEWLSRVEVDDPTIEALYRRNYRPLGACTEFILNDIREHCNGDIQKIMQHIRVVPVFIPQNSGTVTGKYSARDKITSSAVDLLGEEALSREMNLRDTTNPYKYDLRRGALARVAGGGIHFSDEMFKNKPDLVQVYLQVVQNRNIEINGFRWPIDVVIIATSNNDEYNRFTTQKQEGPIKDRCQICYVAHNTDYKLQHTLTRYSIGSEQKSTVEGNKLHEDPNLEYTLSVAVTLSRLPHSEKLTPIETMKLEAGEVAGEKSVKVLEEIRDELNRNPDVTKRWGQRGIGHRGLGRVMQIMLAMSKTHEGKCLFALDCFGAIEREVLDYVTEAIDREKILKDLATARKEYRRSIKTSIFNAYRDDPNAIKTDVFNYVNMIIGIDSDQLGPEKMWRYLDPQTGKARTIKIDERFIDSVEARLGLTTKERKETFRTSIRKIYGQKITTEPNYDFMDNESLVKAVTDVRLESDVAGAASLIGALTNRTNDENVRIHNRMIESMREKLGYCDTCAPRTIEYYCTKKDEN